MAVDLRILLILIALRGIYSITTVSEVSVKAGNSISIPCLYDSRYRNHVKYLCKGHSWDSCSYAVKTNQANSEKFLISDDKTRRTFTVTIKDLTDQDAHYWCAVEIIGSDVRKYFHLLVTTVTPSLYVDRQQVRAFEGGDITINCYHRNFGEIKWCRLGGSCVRSSGSIDGTNVSIKTKTFSLFTVIMSGLKMESSGWYLCVKGHLQMPVHLTVDERPTATTHATTTTTTHLMTVSPTPVSLTTGFADEASATVQEEQHRASFDLKSLLIPLCLLVFFVMTTLFIWFMLKRQKQSKAAAAAETVARCSHLPRLCSPRNGRSAEMEITYSTIDHKNKTSRQITHAESDVDTVYSSVVTVRPKTARKTKYTGSDVDTVYSSVVTVRPKTARKTKYTGSDVDTVYSSVVTVRPKTARKVQASDKDVIYSTLASQQHT